MKECRNCHKLYDDNHVFCPECGDRLVSPTISTPSTKRHLSVIVGLVVAFLLLLIGREFIEFQNQKREITEYQRSKRIEEYRNSPKTTDLTINSDWDYYYKGNYIYIKGRVSNNSSKDISYYEICVKFLDSNGTVLDTDWTNGTDLYAGDTQQFEVMHKYLKFSRIQLYVKEVS